MEKTSTLLSKIENNEMVLPEFQREFTWSRRQSLELIDSLLKEYPIGSLLIWRTSEVPALKNMPDFEANGRVDILLDGQQRLTALYMLIKDEIPPYYSERDIEAGKDPRNLYFNLETRALGYYKQIEMSNNPRWVRVADCFQSNSVNLRDIAKQIAGERDAFDVHVHINNNYNDLRSILEKSHSMMYVKDDADLKHALTVFDRVNSNGTPLGEADIALAHMCSAWPETRRVFKEKLSNLKQHGFDFDLNFLIRSMNAVINGRAEYKILHDATEEQLIAGWRVLEKLLDYLINILRDRAYIYSTDDLNTSNVLIPVLGYLAQNNMRFQDDRILKKLIYWIYAALYQSRYGGSVDQRLERDLNTLADDRSVDGLIAVLQEDHGEPKVTPENLDTRGVGHPLYNMSCIVIRAKGGVDWSNGVSLSRPIGQAYSIERHHIFPGAYLYEAGYDTGKNLIHKKRVNEIANRVPLTRSGNMDIFYSPPSDYLPIVQQNNPGNLEKFMIPMDNELWKVEHYEDFLAERRKLIAQAINEYMENLLEDQEGDASQTEKIPVTAIISQGENDHIEFKSTLRWNIRARRNDDEIQHSSLKTIAAFLNTEGGILLIGINDAGEPVGLEDD
ncbi:DUF262 domain-containing protein, partial [candidate division KSB3 bacterium]|nr:DUF262 domain-containing protein [candidate division KSB3 bacterium]MBD3325547.1 DUF262 domain-containing protein [candidate division KSB3 bacterium]